MFGNAPDPITFHEVSLLMAREPEGEMAEDQVLGGLVSAFWRGEFEDESGVSCVFRLSPPGGALTNLLDGLWIGEGESGALRRIGEWSGQTRDLVVRALSVSEKTVPKELLETARLDTFLILSEWPLIKFSKVTREVYLEPLSIMHEDLRQWFLNNRWEAPKFLAGFRPPPKTASETIDVEPTVEPTVKPTRQKTSENMAKQGNKYQHIVDYARKKWRNLKAPDFAYMAGEICKNKQSKELAEETVRKILAGRYGPAKKMGISGYVTAVK
jgi:hypothetical protein